VTVRVPGAFRGRASRRSFLGDAAVCGLVLASSTKATFFSLRAAEKEEGGVAGKPNDLNYRSATELARLIRGRTISSEEAVRACLSRISEVNPKLNAVCHVDEKGALTAFPSRSRIPST
jgi:hypothetical protein